MQDRELEQQVRLIAEEVLDGLLDSQRPPPPSLTQDADRLGCSVVIHGDWNGEVVVHASRGLAEAVAWYMYLGEANARPAQEDAQEALREIANIVAGNVKPMLGEANSLGLPKDVSGDGAPPERVPLTETVVERGDERLVVRVFTAL